MASLQVRPPDLSATKHKAFEDAKKMQNKVADECSKAGKEAPPYQLSELIGKGSFGRVYKANSLKSKQLVAVKIIDIEESDTLDPKLSDTYSDLLKEISALQLLADSGAKNVNHVIEALPVGQSMWMITEYCAGGSVATLMKPTAPGGLQDKWIIPILREVAEGLHWVHGAGIIHRDIKCANVLVTETGNVQLCDFGVAGVIETKFDKRTTVIGTLHWMAPELFDPAASYGTEVDIWAFGAMVYEIASGFPPNVSAGMDFARLGNQLKQSAPRLEGDQYSAGLKDIIAYCLQHDPKKRPTATQLQRHRYLAKTEEAYPTSSLAHLVKGFRLWESRGGDRRSLFALGGAQAPSDISSTAAANDEWNFSTTAAFDQEVFKDGDTQDVFDAYGANVDFQQGSFEETARPQQNNNKKGRRRPPPTLPSVKAPLEKIFDPNTMSNYLDNSRLFYGRPFPMPVSDLPLRDESAQSSDVRESLIDLDASLDGGDLSNYVDFNTIRAGGPATAIEHHDFGDPNNSFGQFEPDYDQPPLSDPADQRHNRRTQDWKFPAFTPATTEDVPRLPFQDDPGSARGRPRLVHQTTEPIGSSNFFSDLAPSHPSMENRASMGSLIDLDMSMPASVHDYPRPSTSHSEAGSISGSEMGSTNPFELEKHASLYAASPSYREPSIFVPDDSEYSNALRDLTVKGHELPQSNEHLPVPEKHYSLSDFAGMDPEDPDDFTPQPNKGPEMTYFPSNSAPELTHFDPPPFGPPPHQHQQLPPPPQQQDPRSRQLDAHMPRLPMAPSPHILQGRATQLEIKEELRKMAMSLGDHLSYVGTCVAGLPLRRGSSARSDIPDDAI